MLASTSKHVLPLERCKGALNKALPSKPAHPLKHISCTPSYTAPNQLRTSSWQRQNISHRVTCSASGSGDAPANPPPVDPQLQKAKSTFRIPPSTMFHVLSTVSAVLGTLALCLPDVLLDQFIGSSAVMTATALTAEQKVQLLLLRLGGATLILSSSAEACLKDSAANGRLQSATYQRLLLGCLVKSVGYLVALASVPAIWNPLLLLLYIPASLFSILINAATLWASRKNPSKPAASVALPLLPTSTSGWLYTWLAVGFLVVTAACYIPSIGVASLTTASLAAVNNPTTQLLARTCAPGLFLAAVACLNIRDAADRGRIGASTFKTLNLGLAGLSVPACASLWVSGLVQPGILATAPVVLSLGRLALELSATQSS